VNVFGDYFDGSGVAGYHKALAIKAIGTQLCRGECRVDRGTHDPAAGARLGFNTTISAEYARAGLKLTPWPCYSGSVLSGINLIESLIGINGLIIHSRCTNLIAALINYMRTKQGAQWVDRPADPQHPAEDMIDALRGGLLAHWPEGRKLLPKLARVNPRGVF